MKNVQRLLVLLLLFICGSVTAQNVVTGKVTNKETGEPLQGVSVLADKASGGAVTKEDGTFSLKYKPGASNLLFSYVGFASQTIAIGTQTSFDIKLAASAGETNEVVVIGYGTQRKSSVTGAVAKYKNDRLDELPVSRLDQALQGKMAGVQVQNISSEAGAAPKIKAPWL
jgi:TonB-dependent starch-binding outer membrane protein SusC